MIKRLMFFLILCNQLQGVTLFTTLSETMTDTIFWGVRSNTRYAHQFTAGGAATITSVNHKLTSQQKYPSQTKIVIYANNSINNTVSTKLGEFTYSSIDGSNIVTYTGSVSIPSAGTYWFEVQPTAAIGNHYYPGTSSANATGSTSGWVIKRTKVASGEDSVSWSYFDGAPYSYPQFALLGSSGGGPQTVTTLAAAVDLTSSIYLTNSGTTLDLSGATLTATGQAVLVDLTGLDGSLDSINKLNITTLKLGGNSFTTIPANIFTTFPNLTTLELQGNTYLTTLNANSFNGLSLTTLRLDGCTGLTTLPANAFNGLSVSGTLNMNGNTSFTTLASGCFTGLTLTGSLRLDGNTSLITIPVNTFNGLTIGGNLQLSGNTAMTTIAANTFNGLTIQGTIEINNNSNLVSLHADAFDGATVGGTLQLNGNTNLTHIPEKIMTRFFGATTVSGDIRLDSTGLTSLETGAFFAATVSNDLRVDSNPALTALPTTAFQNASIGNDLRIDSVAITKIPNLTFKDTVVGNDLRLDNNTALTKIEPRAFQDITVTGNINLEGTTALTKLPFCAFDIGVVTGMIQLNDSGLVNALPASATKTKLTNGVTQTEIQQILRANTNITQPVSMAEYAQVVKVKKKSLGLHSAAR